jgi:hypothetical protein
MKEEILNIASDLREGFITSNEAKEQLLLLFDVSGRSEQLCSCSSKILPDGNIQFSLCRKCQIEMKEHNCH